MQMWIDLGLLIALLSGIFLFVRKGRQGDVPKSTPAVTHRINHEVKVEEIVHEVAQEHDVDAEVVRDLMDLADGGRK